MHVAMHGGQLSNFCTQLHVACSCHAIGTQDCRVVFQTVSRVSKLLQDEKQALHKCVQAALAETQNAAGADRAATLNGQGTEADVDAAVNAQIQQRRNQKVTKCSMQRKSMQLK